MRALGACVVLAGLSLLLSDQPSYDPYAWLIWGREIAHGGLDTTAGPSWKPLPVAATTVLSLFGDDAAPLLWLVVARTAGLLALVLAFDLARQLAGTLAGVLAVVGLATAREAAMFCSRGTSEGLLVALALLAVLRHVDGRPRQAFALITAAALLRPEVWPIMAVYGLWLARRRASGRIAWRTLAGVVAAGALVLVAWLLPEHLGSGKALRAASRALEPVAGTPAQASRPFLAVFANSAQALAWPLYAGGVAAVVVAWRRRRDPDARLVIGLATVATAYMVTVAALAEAGFTGTLRYVTLPVALTAVLGGIGWARVLGLARRRLPVRTLAVCVVVALAVTIPFVVASAVRVGRDVERTQAAVRLYGALADVLDRAGGAAAVRACGPLYTGPFQTQVLAWELHVHPREIGTHPEPPGTRIWPASLAPALDADFPPRFVQGGWTMSSTCALGG